MKFEIVCDSASDLDSEFVKKSEVTVVPFYVSMDGEHYLKEKEDISVHDFYQRMADEKDCFPKTSMPSIQDYIDAFTSIVKKGHPVLCICLTKVFSGSMQAAVNAKMAVEEEYEDADIYVMDSQLVTALQGLFVKEAVRLRDLDLEMEKAIPLLEEIRQTGHIFFTTKDLKYLQHGGRLGKVSCVAGSVLNLKPVLQFFDGNLRDVQVCRGRKKSIQKIIDKFFEYIDEKKINLNDYYFGTGIGLEIPEYEDFKKNLEERFRERNIRPDEWVQIQIGATIGVHTGPYPMGLGILKKCNI